MKHGGVETGFQVSFKAYMHKSMNENIERYRKALISACENEAIDRASDVLAKHGYVKKKTCKILSKEYWMTEDNDIEIYRLSCGHSTIMEAHEQPSYCSTCGAEIELKEK